MTAVGVDGYPELLEKLLEPLVFRMVIQVCPDLPPRLARAGDGLWNRVAADHREQVKKLALEVVRLVRAFAAEHPELRQLWEQTSSWVSSPDQYVERVVEFVRVAKNPCGERPWETLDGAVMEIGVNLTLNDMVTMVALELLEQDRLQGSKEPGRLGQVTAG